MARPAITQEEFDAVKVRMRQRKAAGEVITSYTPLEYNAVLSNTQDDWSSADTELFKTLTPRILWNGIKPNH